MWGLRRHNGRASRRWRLGRGHWECALPARWQQVGLGKSAHQRLIAFALPGTPCAPIVRWKGYDWLAICMPAAMK